MERKTILVTGIGGNVGQGIIRNIIASEYPVKIIGTNISVLSAGNHLVDLFYEVPYGYDNEYIPLLKKISEKEKVDLIIPSTDYETYFLSKNQNEFSCKIACSGTNSTEIYLDKFVSWQMHEKHNIPFAKSVLPSDYKSQFNKAIAKPRKGRGSKGLIFNYTNDPLLKDEEYLIQELHEGTEITTAVYRSFIDDEILGLISMERSLENGATTYCKVISDYDEKILEIAKGMTKAFDLKGSFNIQSIITKKSEIIPFEINCRISGTNSIRSSFGFKDVQYTIEELLWGIKPEKPEIIPGIAFRYLSDIIYPNPKEIKGINKDNIIKF